jgi:hypothetical protein
MPLPCDVQQCYLCEIRDASVREMVERIRKFANETLVTPEPGTSILAGANMSHVFDELQPRIGELLRTLDDEDIDQFQATSPPPLSRVATPK